MHYLSSPPDLKPLYPLFTSSNQLRRYPADHEGSLQLETARSKSLPLARLEDLHPLRLQSPHLLEKDTAELLQPVVVKMFPKELSHICPLVMQVLECATYKPTHITAHERVGARAGRQEERDDYLLVQ